MRSRSLVLVAICAAIVGCSKPDNELHPTRELAFAEAPTAPAGADTSVGATVSFTVSETSPDNAGAAGVGWTITRDGAAYLSGVIGSVVANSSLTVTTTLTETVAGHHDYVITIDAGDTIDETDETNNTAIFAIDWVTPVIAPG